MRSHHRLGEQRVAAASARRAPPAARASRRRPRAATRRGAGRPSAGSGSRNVVETVRRTTLQPGRRSSSSSRARHSCITGRPQPAREVFDQVERALVRPVDVLPGEHQRPLAGERLERPRAPRRRSPRARSAGPPARARELPPPAPEQARERRDPALGLLGALALGQQRQPAARPASRARSRRRRRRRSRSALRASRSAARRRRPGRTPEQRPLSSSGSVSRRVPAALELEQQARLADAGLADERQQVGAPSRATRSNAASRRAELLLAPDQRRRAAPRPASAWASAADLDRLPGRHRLGLALQLQRLERAVDDLRGAQAPGALADEDPADRRGRLQARGDVDRVAEDRVGTRRSGRRAPRRCSRPPAARAPCRTAPRAPRSARPSPPACPSAARTARAGSSSCASGRAEHGHHVVADELVDAAAVALHLVGEARQAALDQRLDGLVVEPLGDRGVAREVGEQDRDRAALLGLGRAALGGRGGRRAPTRRADAVPSAAPQPPQKLAPGAPPPRRRDSGARSGVPQAVQNAAPAGLAAPQDAQLS